MANTGNAVVSYLREQLKGAHRILEGTMDGVTAEQAHWVPPGRALAIGAQYAHIVLSEDGVVNGLLKGGAPLFATTWAGKTGVSEPPPGPDPEKPGFPDWSEWARQVRIDLDSLREYAQAVYAGTDGYLASLVDADLSRSVDLAVFGLGQFPVARLLNGGVLGNALTHCGEISCLKGLQNAKGYPS